MAPDFIPDIRVAREFYAATVRPLLEEQFPRLRYAAALLGPGSEVAGFDSPRSPPISTVPGKFSQLVSRLKRRSASFIIAS